jgi:hypothetical protein
MDDIWQRWLADVAEARGLDAAELQARIERTDEELVARGGDTALLASEWGLVDGILNEDEVYDLLLERGATNDDERSGRHRCRRLPRLSAPASAARSTVARRWRWWLPRARFSMANSRRAWSADRPPPR